MTFLIIVLVIFLIVWFCDSSSRKEKELKYKERTITNVELQDRLECKYFKKVISELEAIDKATPLDYADVIPTIETLFKKYDLPDTRTAEEKQETTKGYIKDIAYWQRDTSYCGIYPADASTVPFCFKIYLCNYSGFPTPPPFFEHPELLYGDPNCSKTVDGFTFEYNHTGRAKIWDRAYKLIDHICTLLTTRELYQMKLNYSYDRKESLWQRSDAKIKEYEENKKNYPWLFK